MKKYLLHLILLITIFVLAIFIFNQEDIIKELNKKIDNSKNLENKNIDLEKTCTGAIEGELSYPSEIVPNGSIVCAKNLGTNNYYCTPNQVIDSKYRNKKAYRLEVPSGIYSVSAIFPFLKDKNNQPSLEFKYSGDDCMGNECRDENVSVMIGCETVSNIDLFKIGVLNLFQIFFEK